MKRSAGIIAALMISWPVAWAQAPSASFTAEIAEATDAMMTDPAAAFAAAEEAMSEQASPAQMATALWLQAEALTRLSRPSEALDRIAKARTLAVDHDTKLSGDLSLAEARAHSRREDEALALAAYQDAHAVFERVGDRRGQALALTGIGNLYKRARRWDRALDYFAQAGEAYGQDDAITLALNNNEGSVLRRLGHYREAQAAFTFNLNVASRLGTPYPIARTHLNLADVALDLGDLTKAHRHITAAAAYADAPGANTWHRFDLLVRARLAIAEGDDAAAARLLGEIFASWDGAEPRAANERSHEVAASFYERSGDLARALAHTKALAIIDAGLNGAAAANSFNLLNAEFEAAGRELEIERLENARLAAEVAATNARERTRTLVTAALGLALAGVLLTVLWHLRTAWAASRVLEETNAELEEANRVKTRFLANTSHEIRTPLNAVLGMTEAMLSDQADPLSEGHKARLGTIQRSGTLLLGIVSDILDVSKMEEGKMGARPAPTDLADVARSLVAMHGPNAAAKDLTITLDVAPGLPAYVTDERLLTQALGNLLGNAVKFTEVGGVTLSLRAREDGFEAVVRDTGIGIAPGKLETVFDAFAQVDDDAARRFGGTGLGLAIVRNIAELLGGTVSADSAPGRGAAFTLRVPAERAAAPEAPADAESVPEAGTEALATARVLLAEDNPVNVQVVRALIGKLVGALDVAQDGADAVERVRMQTYDLILMDNQMPGMSGAQATAAIRRMPGRAHTPIIGVTGDVAPTVRQELLDAGMDAIVAKPVSRAALVAAMAEAVGRTADVVDARRA